VLLDSTEWRKFFDSYRHEAFRLETLSVYQWPAKGEYETFLATGIRTFRTMTPG